MAIYLLWASFNNIWACRYNQVNINFSFYIYVQHLLLYISPSMIWLYHWLSYWNKAVQNIHLSVILYHQVIHVNQCIIITTFGIQWYFVLLINRIYMTYAFIRTTQRGYIRASFLGFSKDEQYLRNTWSKFDGTQWSIIIIISIPRSC